MNNIEEKASKPIPRKEAEEIFDHLDGNSDNIIGALDGLNAFVNKFYRINEDQSAPPSNEEQPKNSDFILELRNKIDTQGKRLIALRKLIDHLNSFI